MKVGRKTKLTPQIQTEILEYIEVGNYVKVSCRAVGIDESTYYNWLNRGKTGEEPFAEFFELASKAEAKAEVGNVEIVHKAGKRDWKAALELLARKYSKRWGRKQLHGGVEDSPIQVEIKNKELEKELIEKLDVIRERTNVNKEKK